MARGVGFGLAGNPFALIFYGGKPLAAHANPSTTHKHYDRRKLKAASATE
jgi:hypothetical protein